MWFDEQHTDWQALWGRANANDLDSVDTLPIILVFGSGEILVMGNCIQLGLI